MTDLTPHFTDAELACQCGCGFGSKIEDWNPGFLEFIETVRLIADRPLHPTSGARCTAHNTAVGGVRLSAHTRAAATDFRANNGYERHTLVVAYTLALAVTAGKLDLAAAIEIAFALSAAYRGGIGISKGFVHMDTDNHLPRPSAWGYPSPKKKVG